MSENYYAPQEPLSETTPAVSLKRYTAQVFLIMFLGLMVSFALAFFFTQTFDGYLILCQVDSVISLGTVQMILLVAELVVVIAMSAMIQKLSPAAATVCFFIYAVLTGLTFVPVFVANRLESLALIFGFTALYFGGMAVFGFFTSIDLSRIRTLLVGGLIFLIVANLLMLFIPGLQVMDRVLCTIGVVVFLAYTAYDTQKIKTFYAAFQNDDAMLKKAGVISALQLYLDFVNLFLYLLRLFGKKRN